MTKKWIIIIITILVVGGLTTGYFFFRGKLQPTNQPINAIPEDAVLILETDKLPDLTKMLAAGKNDAWNEISKIKELFALSSQVNYLDSVIFSKSDVNNLIQTRQVIISLHPTGKDKYNFLYVLGTENAGIYEKIKIWVEENIQNNYSVKERENDGVTFFEGELKNNPLYKKFSYAFHDGLFIFSFSSLLVEKAVDQLKNGSPLTAQPLFNKVYEAKGKNVPASIFVNYEKIGNLLKAVMNSEKSGLALGIKNISGWSLLDLKINNNLLIMYGFSACSDSIPSYLQIFKNQKPMSFGMDEVLPLSTSFFLCLGIEKPGVFQTDYKKYLKASNKLSVYDKYLQEFKASYDKDPEEIFRSFMGNEVALVNTQIKDLDAEENSFILIKTGSGDFTRDKMIDLLKAYASAENIEYSSLVSKYILDNDKSYPVYSFPFPEMPGILFGDFFNELQPKFFGFYKNYLIFARSKEAVSSFIYANVLQKVLCLDLDFIEFKETLSSSSSIFIWSNLAAKQLHLEEYLLPGAYQALDNAFSNIGKFQGIALQFSPSGEFVYNNIYLKYNPKVYREDPKTVWESHLDTCIAIKPKFVVNHDSEETEVFVQDMNNIIYLLNSTGRVLWKKGIKERIMSDVFQIDYYDNGKLQLLFNTKTKVYLIDRLGNNVERFPVELRAEATNGLSLFDYENNKDYRLFIACNDGKVYAMDKDGSLLKGWDFEETEHPVKTSIQHFRISDKDYIVFSDSMKTYILDRKGASRVDVQEYFPASGNNSYKLDKDPKTKKHRLVTTTSSGKPVFVYFDGSVVIKELSELSYNHYFELNDLDGDGYNDYIFLDGNKLVVYNYEFFPMFSKEFETASDYPPIFFVFPDNQRRLGIVEQDNSLIYLIEQTGELYDGFPLKGFSPFSIGNMGNKDGVFNLLVGSKNNFLYNYTVH